MHKEYILLNGFRKAKKGFTAGFHVPLNLQYIMYCHLPLPGDSLTQTKSLMCDSTSHTYHATSVTLIMVVFNYHVHINKLLVK